ncbi:MAG: hypothetical protein KF878_13730 [Planctomycetes bacterium]|nr:hypothetical protein [Planctomycetota bacterium]
MVHNLADFLTALTSAFCRQLVLGFGLLALVGLLLSLTQRWIFLFLFRAIGLKGVVTWTGWLGTPLHELSHYLVGKLFLIEITRIKLWEPDPDDGVLGFVRYRIPRLRPSELHKVIGTFLMGVAPLFGGALFLLAALHLTSRDPAPLLLEARRFATLAEAAPLPEVARGFGDLIRGVYLTIFSDGPLSWRPWVFLYLAMCVGAHLAPSRADLRGGFAGFLVLLVLALFANAVALLLRFQPANAAETLARVTGPLTVMLLLALVLNCGNLLLAAALAWAAPRWGRRG